MDTTSSSPAKQPQEAQVMAFASRSELGRYASSLQLMRIPLCDLEVGCVLTDTYAGGRVRGTYSGQLTQGSLAFLLQDDSRSSGYVQCVVSGDLTRLLPRSAELSSGELFVTGAGARVGPSAPECSQESEVEIAVEGDDGKIWIVNRCVGSLREGERERDRDKEVERERERESARERVRKRDRGTIIPP